MGLAVNLAVWLPALGLIACLDAAYPPAEPVRCEWPAGRDMVDPRTGEKGVFLTEPEWQQLWDCRK